MSTQSNQQLELKAEAQYNYLIFDLMRSTHLGSEPPNLPPPEETQKQIEKLQNEHYKPSFFTAIHKVVPIGYELHQIDVPDFHPPSQPTSQLPPLRCQAVFLHTRVQEEELQQYLAFVENYYEEKVPDYFSQGVVSRDRTRAKAMDFLHDMGYNYTKAKFYLLFPYYLTFNRYRCHQPLNFSDQDMARRIADHLQGLKSTKQKQLEKWIGTVENSIQSRIHLSKLNMLIQVAKQNKYQIPEAIRENVQKAIRTGRQIKKALHSTRLPIDKLLARKESLQECKIITNQMIQFEETVTRCEDWLKKQQAFEETYFLQGNTEPVLKPLKEKIQFRTIQLLVNEFNNLPLVYDNFESTTGALYRTTISLLQGLPPISKAAKTRTAQSSQVVSRVSIQSVQESLQKIYKNPVQHDQFGSFQASIRQHLQWLQRIGLWLQDQRSQKTLKILNQYSKIVNDIPIANTIQPKLQSRLEYYQIMQKVKKDISNPAKYQQIKDAIKKLKEKGYQTCEYAKLQTRILSYMRWYQNQQKLNQQRLPATKLQLLTQRRYILERMIPLQDFKEQLNTAKSELNIPEEVWIENQRKTQTIDSLRDKISKINQQSQPCLDQIIETVRACIKNGLLFEQFAVFYDRMIEIFFLIAQMEFLLFYAGETPNIQGQQFLFNSEDLQYVFGVLNSLRNINLKDLQTKQGGDQILNQVRFSGFPKKIISYKMFQQFMGRAETWSQRAEQMIRAFKQQSGQVSIRQLIDQSKNCLHSKVIQQQLNRIDIVLKWRQKISKKMIQQRQDPFQTSDRDFLLKLQKDLQQFQKTTQSGDSMRTRALEYYCRWGGQVNKLLQKISTIQIESTYKLSQMNKFCKQIDKQIQKYNIQDRIIKNLKEDLQNQLQLSDQWKQRYISIKRFQRKKLKKDEEQQTLKQVQINIDLQGQGQGSLIPYVPAVLANCETKHKYYIRNGQFVWYFKLLLMIFEFYNGFTLKFSIEELVRLRATLSQIHRFICHFNTVMMKPTKNDYDLQNLELEGSKFSIFFRETYILSRKNAYLTTWKQLANSVLKSVPVLGMQLKARKPQQLLELLQSRKNKKQEVEEQKVQQLGSKRKRKQNPYYNNDQMTLLTEDTFGIKTKKKKKGLNPDTQYRNTAVASHAKKTARNQKQDFERAQALLNGDVPAQLIHIDDPKQYCICRYGVPNENSVMVQCQHKCEEWFHIECLGIKKHQTKNDAKLICVGCLALYNIEPTGYFFWDTHAKITQYALTQLVQQGKNLGVQTTELRKLEILYDKMKGWKSGVKDILKRVCETNSQELPSLQPSLYQLFLQSLWLPTAHPQAAILQKLVLMARNEL